MPHFLGPNSDIGTLIDHIVYVAKRFGAEHAGIGTDLSYISRNDEAESRKVPDRADGHSPIGHSGTRWEHLWPGTSLAGARPKAQTGLSWTNWPLFTVGLVQRGRKDDDIRKILGENVLRVVRANHAGSDIR